MKKTYLLIHNDVLGTREQVKNVLDSAPMVTTWRYDIPHAFYIISEASAKEIATHIQSALGDGRLVVAEIATNYWGHTHRDTWEFLKNKGVRSKD